MKQVFLFLLLSTVALGAGACVFQAVLRESVQAGVFGGLLILVGIVLAGELN
jgi:uncharacterized transporter YbjL